MSIELSEAQKEIFNRIMDAHKRKKECESNSILIESEIVSLKSELMKSLGFKNYMKLLSEAAPLFY